MQFVDLNRHFVPLKEDQEPSLDIGRFWGPRVGGWLSWGDLRQRQRVILLAEAASGKTEEFRHQCDVIRAAGNPAFFIRIDALADHGTEASLDGEGAKLFEAWLDGSGEGWFFLDSVDEARLNRKSFDAALIRFARDLGASLERAHMYISCRATDWRGAADRATVSRYLPAWKRPTITSVAKPDDHSALLDPLFKESNSSHVGQPAETNDSLDTLLVVQLVPLSTEQYRALATEAAVADVDEFVKAITRHGLEVLTERPGDLLDLANYWNSHSKFDTFAEMLGHSVTRKLSERDPYRPDNEAISPKEAREGAECLAAALTLGKSITLRSPDDGSDATLAAGALNPADILISWTDARRNALLRRGIFAPATYGRARFHHRSAQEYLTASWLDRLLCNGCPSSEISLLLFAERYGVETVVPSLRPVAAWLSLRHPDIRDEIIRREPLTLLAHGDPGSLPISVREQLLLQYATKRATAQVSGGHLDTRALWMFADKRLASALEKAWQVNTRDDFRFELLQMIREGRIKGASSLATSVALNKEARSTHRIVAAQAVDACGDTETLTALAEEIVRKPEVASPFFASWLSLILYPRYLSTHELLEVIAKSRKPREYSTEGFGHLLQQFYDKASDAGARATLLGGLADLCLSQPFKADYYRLAKNFDDIAKNLHHFACNEVLRLNPARSPPSYLVRLLMVVERADREGPANKAAHQLHELVRGNSNLNRALFWADVAEHRANMTMYGPISNYWQIYFGGNLPLWGFSQADLPWLYADLVSRPDIEDKQIALSAVLTILHDANRLAAEEAVVRTAIRADPVLLAALQASLVPPPESRTTQANDPRRDINVLKARKKAEATKVSWIRFRSDLLKDPTLLSGLANLTSWEAGIFRLFHVTHWLQKRTGSYVPRVATEWRLLEEGFDRAVAEAYRDGMKHVWREIAPVRPIRDGGNVTKSWPSILALAGIGVEASEDSDWTFRLTEGEATLAARHACCAEEDYPDWLDALTMSRPTAVLPVLRDQMDREWASPPDTPTNFLHHYSVAQRSIQQSVQALIIAAILKTEAKAVTVLYTAIRIIRNLQLDATRRAELLAAAKRRFRSHVETGNDDFALPYLALILILDPDASLPILAEWLNAPHLQEGRKARAERTLSKLFDPHDPLASGALAFATTATLEALLHLTYSHIRPEDDLVHHGSYSPGPRDNAEDARNVILSALLERPGADAYQALQRLANDPVFALRSHRFQELARGKAERDAEIPAWTAAEVLAFEREWTAPAKTGIDLLRVVMGVLADIDQDLSKADFTSRALLERAKDEEEVQLWLAEQMKARSRGRFHADRESEVAMGDKPDLIIASTSAPCQVAVEVKHGAKDWSARDLESALRTQLAEDYLKPDHRRHGVLVITRHNDRRWQRPRDKKRISFPELIEWLSGIAATITNNAVGSVAVKCVGINAWKAEPSQKERKAPKAITPSKGRATVKNARKKPKTGGPPKRKSSSRR